MPRQVRLLVVNSDGVFRGAFHCRVETPWLQETSDVLAVARAAGLSLSIVRLLEHSRALGSDDVRCTYLAEATGPISDAALVPDADLIDDVDEPLRLPYARLGGNAEDIAWADARLRELGLARASAAEQQRTWNLSCVHRLPLKDGSAAWLKTVPPFFAHEGAVIELLLRIDADPALRLPRLLARDATRGRVLLADCPGALMWGSTVDQWRPIVDAYVARQYRLRADVDALLAVGVADWRAPALLDALRKLAARADVHATLNTEQIAQLQLLIDALPARFDALAECSLPETLVHGDLHMGNVIANAEGPVLLDWGDAGVGHPLLDLPALVHGFAPEDHAAIREACAAAWHRLLPRADIERAMELIAPIAQLRQALIYRGFLDGIEPSERHHHESDVPDRIGNALRSAGLVT